MEVTKRSQTQAGLGPPPLGGPQRIQDRWNPDSGSISMGLPASAVCGNRSWSSGEMTLSSAYLSQVAIREAVQVLLETTDVNRVLVPVDTEARMVRPAQNTAA